MKKLFKLAALCSAATCLCAGCTVEEKPPDNNTTIVKPPDQHTTVVNPPTETKTEVHVNPPATGGSTGSSTTTTTGN